MPYNAGDIVSRAIDCRDATERIEVKEFYEDCESLDVDSEIAKLQYLPTTEENILRIENLKRIRTKRRWFGQWFENTCKEIQKSGKKRQYVFHSNPKFYWPWNPETVLVDTTFVNIYNDGTAKVKKFEEVLFPIDFADSWYSKVIGRNTLNKLGRILDSEETNITGFDKPM